jgi:hypothetical protein
VKKAIAWLALQRPSEPTSMAIRALTLVESFGMSRRGRQEAVAAVGDLIACQRFDGGWDEHVIPNARHASKLSPTTWAVLALKSAKVVGLAGAGEALDRTLGFLKREQAQALAQVDQARVPAAVSAVGVARLFAGGRANDEAVRELAGIVADRTPAWPAEGLGEEVIAWYHGTLLTYDSGEGWRKWNKALRETLLAHQVHEGAEKGSWDPRTESPPFRWGRVGATALATLSLEVYLRYSPHRQGRPAPGPGKYSRPKAARKPVPSSASADADEF